jgi:hypothetical protein
MERALYIIATVLTIIWTIGFFGFGITETELFLKIPGAFISNWECK